VRLADELVRGNALALLAATYAQGIEPSGEHVTALIRGPAFDAGYACCAEVACMIKAAPMMPPNTNCLPNPRFVIRSFP
jgi:hypothetical protein